MNNKGFSLVEMMAVIIISSIVMFTLAQLVTFLYRGQDIVFGNNQIINDGGIMINELEHLVDGIGPESVTIDGNEITFVGNVESIAFEIITNPDLSKEFLINGVPLQHDLKITAATITEADCKTCEPQRLYIIEFTLEIESRFLSNGVNSKNFKTSLHVLDRGI